ncbi:hypothetical protein EMIHUDRAFT_447551 [Emiliania huxleyi CCMP1516]|uniref:Kringle domain-containing protein n=2 Tax=Emiliania huxleyi TaxID=2903 RepID=A0A0D3L1Y9_EMIH1|nr:hypothetical protein EMIHUDRAFT_459313 [Emiliania huxleyi CCMP1516]XP_005794453.1 hypothetical protein EMIHUDRAFT_447551 [Emiliania huxleyi CCMP1516]EOD15497.1 hypothetical protein EMIHUDRAFT_459313 [Emiliania huxleyi CCMP1516]EOD42024.1 hypothetical protein EMIHUDRAFT_447551 [Emiliania huxleyi CCMP1516]|eukprot:XP_005767926.1 hypothetical protein EMIHUDRAFT_459313 [Emiliania huxleyi CCMP1516]
MSSRLSPCLAVVALLAIAAYTLYRTRAEHRVEIPPVRELAVAVQAANGLYLAVGEDGLVRAGSRSPTAQQAARFRLLPVSQSSAHELQRLSAAHELRSTATKRRTRSGCECSGFSSDYGFGRYCHEWESSFEDPWCYVDDACAGGRSKRGSFGRRHETNEHGYGAHCAAWEKQHDEWQTPWCYVDAACPSGRSGSFGRKHADCVQPEVMMYSRSRRERKFARREAAERQAQEVARQASDFFMLVSERTGAFLAALMLRSTDAKLSDAAVLARMPDGRILAAAARSFLNLCGPFSSLSSGEAETGQAVCAGTRESADEPHFKLLRGNHAMQINTTVLRIQPL